MSIIYKKFFAAIILFAFILSSAIAQPTQKGGVPGACGYGGSSTAKTPSPLDGSGSLGQTFNQTMCGLNYVAATQRIETRYDPYTTSGNYGCGLPCSWAISGLPTCIVPVKAIVYANVSYQSGPPVATLSITNPLGNTFNFSAGAIGTSVSKCWGEAGTAGYRWDVTSSIVNNGSYSFNFSGFGNPLFEIDGATIFIVYQDLSATYDGSLIFWDGAMGSQGGNLAQTLTGFTVCGTPTTGTGFMITSDHQDNIAASHTSIMNGVAGSYPNSFSNFQISPVTLFAGQTSSAFGDQGGGADCFLWTMAGLYYQSNCTTCTPTALNVTQSTTPAACGNNNGTATVNVTGGNPPFTYTWSPAVAGNTNTANNLAPGSYNVTVCDGPGCCTQVTIVINSSAPPTVTATSTPAGCSVQNGSATANPSGGTAPYNYSWNTVPVQNTQTANNLPSGSYVVTITDAAGCTAQATAIVGGSNAPTVTASNTTPTGCSVSNGVATANPTGGTAPYTYAWSPTGGNAATANNLSAGTYTVTVTDANGCSSFATVTIATAAGPSSTASVTANAKCFQGNSGSATATPSGGTAPYTYSWSPSGGNAATASNLGAGNYVVTITDANGCTTTSSVTITQPTAIVTSNISQVNVLCNGSKNGTASINPSGGTPVYTYAWNTVPAQNTQTATGLGAGTYQCTVTDANGCTALQNVTITQPAPLTASTAPVNPKCNGGKGTATATMNGGNAPYTYVWGTTPPQNSQTATGLAAGTYSVTLTDANGCSAVTTVTLTQPQPVTMSITCGDSICVGKSTTLSGSVSGGTPSYTYVWLPGPKNGSAISVNPTASTTYTLTVTDANGCTSLTPKSCAVIVLPAPNANFDTTSSGYLSNMWGFTDSSTGGNSWSWNFGDPTSTGNTSTQQNPIHTFSGAGTYTVTEIVTNKFGCKDTQKVIIKVGEGILIPNVFTPDGDGTNDVWYIPNSGMKEFSVEIYNRWGEKVWEATADEIRWDGRSSAGKQLNDGTYYYVLHAILKSGSTGKNYSTKGYVTLLTKSK